MNDNEIIKKLRLVPIKITGKDLMKIIQEDGADSLADDLNKLKENVNLKLHEMLGEARADERMKRYSACCPECTHLHEKCMGCGSSICRTEQGTAKEISDEFDKEFERAIKDGIDRYYLALKKKMEIE